MSHTPERKEKNCLNCGTTVLGRYCHVCGQENVEPKETFWHMVTHFFKDITHFDGSIFTSLKDLLFKPGFLSKEYMKGRRVSYLHPVRMYLFTSAIFFLLFFGLFKGETLKTNLDEPVPAAERMKLAEEKGTQLVKDPGNVELKRQLELLKDTARILTRNEFIHLNPLSTITINGTKYRGIADYDSIQKKLPVANRDGWLKRLFFRKVLDLNARYGNNPREALDKWSESFLHRLPYMLFVSLPLFALILNLVYSRRRWRKEFFFADHGVFTIHFYIFSFLLLLLVFAVDSLIKITGWGFLNFFVIVLIAGLLLYLYKAMRYFYGQGRGKTILKFFFVCFSSLVMMTILFACFLLFSAITL